MAKIVFEVGDQLLVHPSDPLPWGGSLVVVQAIDESTGAITIGNEECVGEANPSHLMLYPGTDTYRRLWENIQGLLPPEDSPLCVECNIPMVEITSVGWVCKSQIKHPTIRT